MIPVVEILRRESSLFGTFGVLSINKRIFCLTLEPPWRMNQRNISCIPAGQYEAIRIDSPSHGDTFRVQDVPNRAYINFHPGYTVTDTEGCILLGESVIKLKAAQRQLANSGKTFEQFMLAMQDSTRLHLTITEAY